MEVSKEELEAYNWLCALEIHSEAEAIDKEMCLCMLDELNNRNKRIHKLEKNIEFIINKIVNKAKEYQYHTEITAGTNIETNIRQQTLTELLEEIEKEI